MMNVLVTLAYDGTNYCGWQRQKHDITVQGEVEAALKKCFLRDIDTIGASRTDTGVHALGQRFTFIPPDNSIPADRMALMLNTKLPPDIVARLSEEVSADFHPRFDAKSKSYDYKILNSSSKNPLYNHYAAFVRKPLSVPDMISAAEYFLGTHDFAAFCASGSSVKTTVRTVHSLSIKEEQQNGDRLITLSISGSGFLYNMVRIIAGTLIDVGLGRKNVSDVNDILLSRNRSIASATAPPQGLTLMRINY